MYLDGSRTYAFCRGVGTILKVGRPDIDVGKVGPYPPKKWGGPAICFALFSPKSGGGPGPPSPYPYYAPGV